jgi:glycine/D-amino acid oxidase-like deaminating enzyme
LSPDRYGALVIGGGFYGCSIALHLARDLGVRSVAVAERGTRLLGRASYGNQARVHHGYHYPRDFTTAWRSRANFRPFVERYRAAVVDSFPKLYAIARRNSQVSARRFETMMREIGAPCAPAPRRLAALFSPNLVEAVYTVEEFAFDADALAAQMEADLREAGVDILLGTTASVASRDGDDGVTILLESGAGARHAVAGTAFNCTYGMLANVGGAPAPAARLKYEIAEICLVEPPPELRGAGITVMDGPFFSCMPFPARGLHSLTHVHYTPHASWTGASHPARVPYDFLADFPRLSAFEDMRRDAARYVPLLAGTRHVDSIFEVKVVLMANEQNDGRPILVEGEPVTGGVVAVLGGKLDNIFDVLEAIDARERLAR